MQISSNTGIAPPTSTIADRFLVDGAFAFWQIAARHPDRIAIVGVDHGVVRAGDLLLRCNRIANLLRQRGLVTGDAISVVYPNDPEMFAITLAAFQIGLYLVPVNWHLTPPEIAYVLRNSRARAVFAHHRFADDLERAATDADIAADMRFGSAAFGSFASIDEAIADQSPDLPPDRCGGSAMFYTSGTTGHPKGVKRPLRPGVVPEQSMAAALPWQWDMYGLQAGAGAHLVVAPLYHAAPHVRAVQMLHLGHTVVLMDKWLPLEMLQLVERYRITSTQMVPIMFHRLLQLPDADRHRHRLDSLQAVIHAAAPCPVHTKQRMIEWWGPVIHEFYASTEGGGTVVNANDWLAHPGTVGRAYPVSRVVVLDDDGQPLPPGEIGMVYMDDGIGFEYFGDAAKTSASRRDGMFTAGDYGYLDAEGWLYLCDRRVDLIISGGVNIYPAEVEAVLMDHPAIADVAVVGLPDEEWGQRVHAVVQLRDGHTGDEAMTESLRELTRARLANFKRPRTYDYAELPRTDAGKISRSKLRQSLMAVAG